MRASATTKPLTSMFHIQSSGSRGLRFACRGPRMPVPVSGMNLVVVTRQPAEPAMAVEVTSRQIHGMVRCAFPSSRHRPLR
jgi:hypothetical protein